MKIKWSIFPFLLPVIVACQFKDDLYVDFMELPEGKDLKFQVCSQRETDLAGGLPDDCYLMDGSKANEYVSPGATRTTSTSATNIVQTLLKYGNQNRVAEIVGTYGSIDGDGNPITLSGKVMLPAGGKPKRLILVNHYTVCSNAEAPSNCFSLEGVLAKMGYGLVIPDYAGYGVTAGEIHPYLVMDQTARNVLDMYLAVREWLEAVGRAPEHEEICLMGYSQGGATSMAVERLIETEYTEHDDVTVKIHRVFAGGGPYDVKSTYERFVNTDVAGFPVAVPLVLQGMIMGNSLDMEIGTMMQPWLCDRLNEWVNSKKYTAAQINMLIGTHTTHEMLTEEAMDQKSSRVAELYKAMTLNSVVSYNWKPAASVYIMHSMDDETVPFANASSAKSRWKDANIKYNFGHYGGHANACLRFIFSVQSLLKEEEKEMKKYED